VTHVPDSRDADAGSGQRLVVIDPPTHKRTFSGADAKAHGVTVHREMTQEGQRIVLDWMVDEDADRLVLRGVNMTTGTVRWFAPSKGEEVAR
jgi:hypothetical protein